MVTDAPITPLINRICWFSMCSQNCDNGFYSNTTGLSTCLSCQPGSYSVRNGTFNGAPQCTQCAPGKYTSSSSQSSWYWPLYYHSFVSSQLAHMV
jgi:hypothetical protein